MSKFAAIVACLFISFAHAQSRDAPPSGPREAPPSCGQNQDWTCDAVGACSCTSRPAPFCSAVITFPPGAPAEVKIYIDFSNSACDQVKAEMAIAVALAKLLGAP